LDHAGQYPSGFKGEFFKTLKYHTNEEVQRIAAERLKRKQHMLNYCDQNKEVEEMNAELERQFRAQMSDSPQGQDVIAAEQKKEFVKHDNEKNRLGLLPVQAVLTIGKVLTFGARKYAPNNWMRCKDTTRYVDAALRHIFAYIGGEKNDPETGLPHLAHAGCCIMFLIDLEHAKENNGQNQPSD
jgi:hypothetical protein